MAAYYILNRTEKSRFQLGAGARVNRGPPGEVKAGRDLCE